MSGQPLTPDENGRTLSQLSVETCLQHIVTGVVPKYVQPTSPSNNHADSTCPPNESVMDVSYGTSRNT